MTDAEFRTEWLSKEENLRPITLETLENFNLDDSTRNFLLNAGLPADAAPFLSFVGDSNMSRHESINLLTSRFDLLEDECRKYIAIGSDGGGDIIVINSADNFKIEWLDHEDNFLSRFMNTSIRHLAFCLLAYRNFIHEITSENGEVAYLENNFTDAQYKSLSNNLRLIDGRAVKEGFWKIELETLLAK